VSHGDGLARLRRALEEHGCTIRGSNAQCPAHEDRDPSLSIGQGRDSAVLKCHGGCETNTVLEALGMSAADLFDEPRGSSNGYQVTATYTYTDETGKPLFYCERRFPKSFRQYQITGSRKVWNLDGARRVLYQLPRVIEAVASGQPVYLAEGEKDVHAIEAAGTVATCNPMGAGKWRPEYGDTLKGAIVVIVADKDPAGYAHAAAVKADLDSKATVAIVVQAAEGKDVSDHLAAGHTLAELVPVAAEATEQAAGSPLTQLAAFIAQLRTWLDLPDPAHVLLTLAAAATRDLDGEPVWLLLVAVPSSGKTETVRLLDKRADGRLNEVTAAGLLGWTKGKESKPSGVLARLGDRGLVTFGDLSSLLATSDYGGRDAAFGLMRRAYDGHVTRDISPPGKPAAGCSEQLSWSGRLTVVAAVTGAIDRYAVHADQLGPRWVYIRIASRDTEAKRQVTRRARKSELDGHRDAARKTADRLIADAARRIPDDVPDSVFNVIEDAALVTCWGRAAVPRHGYGRREIDGMPVVEDPPRVVRQLHGLARGLLALGLPEDYTAGLIRRVALDSMPEDRRAVLAALSFGEPLTAAALARRAGLHRHVARMRAEELEAIGVVHGERLGADRDEEYDKRPAVWRLAGDDGQLIAAVFASLRNAGKWHEIWVTHSSTPQDQEQDQQEADERYPDFVPPFAAAGSASQ
jgi:hypothetical protein